MCSTIVYSVNLVYSVFSMYNNRLVYSVNTLCKLLIYMDIFFSLFSMCYKLLILLDILLEGLTYWYCWRNNSMENKRLQTNGRTERTLINQWLSRRGRSFGKSLVRSRGYAEVRIIYIMLNSPTFCIRMQATVRPAPVFVFYLRISVALTVF